MHWEVNERCFHSPVVCIMSVTGLIEIRSSQNCYLDVSRCISFAPFWHPGSTQVAVNTQGAPVTYRMGKKRAKDNTKAPVHFVSVGKNVGGNSRNSGHQVQTYKMSEGTLASAYVLCPFQALVPGFQNRGWRSKDWREGWSCSQSRT